MPTKNLNDRLLLLAFLLSGFVALGYEMVWTRMLALVLGGELLGVLGVLAGFFMGMVIGAFSLSQHARKTANPVRMFMILECVIAFYGLVSPFLIYELSSAVPQWLGPVAGDNDSSMSLACSLLFSSMILLPATFGMGANFAYLAEAKRRSSPEDSADKNLSRIYAANTFGATLGTFAAVYWIVPYTGFIWACVVFCVAGILAIYCAWRWAKQHGTSLSVVPDPDAAKEVVFPNASMYYFLLFATGLTAIGLEIVVIHLLKQILENTVFTFANILSIYLVGTAIGAWLYQYVVERSSDDDWQKKLPAQIMFGLLVSIVISFGVLAFAHEILGRFSPPDSDYLKHLMAELWLAVLVFLLPTIFMGALFAYLISRIAPEKLGRAYAVNTLGGAVAPFVVGLALIPWVAPFLLLAVVWVCYWGILGIGTYCLNWSRDYFMIGGVPLMFLAIGLFTQPDLIRLPNGATELQRIEGLMGTVVVSERKNTPSGPLGLPHRLLQVNNQFRMGGGAGFIERRMGNLPLLLADSVDSVLFLGIGTGTTIGVCDDHPVNQITAVEIVPQVKQVLPWFDEHSNRIFERDELSYHASDARRFVSASRDRYDVVVADLYHPARDGAGLLYTHEHFEKLKGLLTDNGLMCQWIPAHQFDRDGLKIVLRSFNKVFPESHLFLAGYNTQTVAVALIGTKQGMKIDPELVTQRIFKSPDIQKVVENSGDLFSTYLVGGEELQAIAGEGPLNSDLHPILLFNAPRSVYLPEQEKSQSNLQWLLKHRNFRPEQWMDITEADQLANPLTNFRRTWQAAGLFLESKMYQQQGRNSDSWKKLVRAYQTQPDFSAARGQLMVTAMQKPERRKEVLGVLNERDRRRLLGLLR